MGDKLEMSSDNIVFVGGLRSPRISLLEWDQPVAMKDATKLITCKVWAKMLVHYFNIECNSYAQLFTTTGSLLPLTVSITINTRGGDSNKAIGNQTAATGARASDDSRSSYTHTIKCFANSVHNHALRIGAGFVC